MVLVSYSGREINAKLVYYGPGLSGKTTNLEYIYGSIPQGQRGKMVSMKTKTERTLFFDFLPVHLGELSGFKTRFLLYTVPGQVYYNATRKLVLKGVDAVVFVADSKRGKMDENVESLENLKENLKEHGLTLEKIPWVIQYNKRDLSEVYSMEELEAVLNPMRTPAYEAVATTGVGVVETFKGISRLLLRKLAKEVGVPVVGSTVDASPAAPTPVAPPAPAPSPGPVAFSGARTVPEPPGVPSLPNEQVPVLAATPEHPGDSSWTFDAGPDAGGSDFQSRATPPGASNDSPVATAGNSGWGFPPVAEPVRIPAPDTQVSLGTGPSGGDEEEHGDHHVSVGERLRRWLSRSPDRDEAEVEPECPVLAPVEPECPVLAAPVEPEQPVPVDLVEPERPVFAAAVEPEPPVPADTVELESPAPVTAPAWASSPGPFSAGVETERTGEIVFERMRPELPSETDAAPEIDALAPERTGTVTVRSEPFVDLALPGAPSIPEPVLPPVPALAPLPPPATVPPAPAAVAKPRDPQASSARRRAREIIVPVELSPEDLERGVTLKIAFRVQQASSDDEEDSDQLAA